MAVLDAGAAIAWRHHERRGILVSAMEKSVGAMAPVTDDEVERMVEVELVLPEGALPLGAARLLIQVEDVSRMDAPSIVVAERRLDGVEMRRLQAQTFDVAVPREAIDPSRSYSVRVHLDANASGNVERGDLVSTASYPVLTRGAGHHARVVMKRV